MLIYVQVSSAFRASQASHSNSINASAITPASKIASVIFDGHYFFVHCTISFDEMKKTVIIAASAGLLLGALSAFQVSRLVVRMVSSHKMTADAMVDANLRKAAEDFNKRCPVIVDNVLRYDSVTALSGKTIMHNCTIDADSVDVCVEKFDKIFTSQILNNIRTNPQLAYMRDAGITFIYRYNDRNGVFLWEYTATPEMYKE